MPIAEILVNLSLLDGYTGYNQIYIIEEYMPKTEF